MRTREAAAAARERLAAAGIENAAFEAEYLVRAAGQLDRSTYFLDPELSTAAGIELNRAIERRERREPGPYITGEREFWGLKFSVGPGVLVPRPETELLVEIAREAAAGLLDPVIVEVGTGSGCVAVSIAVELKDRAKVVATELSTAALAFACANARRHRAPVALVRGDLATCVGRADIVLANLPYIATDEIDALEPEVSRWEPRVALDGGGDGFDLIRRLVADCATRLRPPLLALEVGFGMAAAAAKIGQAHGASVTLVKDLAGIDRIVCCRWP